MYSNELVCKILKYIDDNINKRITIEELATRFYYNRYYIMKLFKKELGLSLIDYINCLRVYNSILAINNSDKLLIRIAIDNGFNSSEYFSEMFRKVMGVAPSEYKKLVTDRYNSRNSNEELITTNLIKLKTMMDKANKYKLNMKPLKMPIRRFSIFDK